MRLPSPEVGHWVTAGAYLLIVAVAALIARRDRRK